jgi:acyl-CoA thioesterase
MKAVSDYTGSPHSNSICQPSTINYTMTQSPNDVLANKVVAHMMAHDAFSQWLQLEVLEVREGYSRVRMTVRPEMVNGFGVAHGGLAFSMADSAFAFACNNRNNLSMALDVSISFTKAVNVGDVLTAEAKELHNGRSTGLYLITITNQHNQQVALFKGTCFRTGKALVE